MLYQHKDRYVHNMLSKAQMWEGCRGLWSTEAETPLNYQGTRHGILAEFPCIYPNLFSLKPFPQLLLHLCKHASVCMRTGFCVDSKYVALWSGPVQYVFHPLFSSLEKFEYFEYGHMG